MKNLSFLFLLLIPQLIWGQGSVFVENKGQWDSRAKFRMSLPEGYAFLESSAITYKLFHPDALPVHPHHEEEGPVARKGKPEVLGHVLRANFLNSQSPQPQGKSPVNTKYNFFIGEESDWAGNARGFQKAHYEGLYPKVDLEIYLHYGHLKYDLIVQPGGSPKAISFVYEGHEGIAIKEGRLQVHTRFNVLEEQVPIAYQWIEGRKVEVLAKFTLQNEVVGFEFPNGYNTNYELIIDPELVFSSYSGSSQDNWGFSATYDSEGNTYTAGLTRGEGSFPVTTGVFRSSPISDAGNSTTADIGILKFSPTGEELIYATYLGGTGTDLPHSLLVNNKNQLIVFGSTGSADFPVTGNAFDRTFNRGVSFNTDINMNYNEGSDIFVTVFNETASALIGSTYVGGTGNDGIDLTGFGELTRNYGDQFRGDLQVDANDNIYFVSTTYSQDFPMLGSGFQRVHGGGQDGVVASLTPNLNAMRWSSFIGGGRNDGVFSARFNSLGQLVICGGTRSTNFPTAGNPLNRFFQGEVDGFVSVISANGQSLLASTFLGTASYDQAYLLDLDENDNVVVFGQTLGRYGVVGNNVYSNPNSGQFLHKLNPSLSNTIFSTVFGSGADAGGNVSINIRPTAFLVSNCGDMFLAGWGGSLRESHEAQSTSNMPTTPDNIPATRQTSAGDDFYLMIMASDATELLYGAYIGGENTDDKDHVDGGTSRFDENGVMYQAACVCRDNNFPSTTGVFASSNGSSNCNNLVFKFDLNSIAARVNPNIRDEETGAFVAGNRGCPPLEVLFSPDSVLGTDLRWAFGDGATAQQNSPGNISHTYTEPGIYQVELASFDNTTCEKVVRAFGTIEVFDTDFDISSDTEICQGDSTTIFASGAITYNWAPDARLTSNNTSATIAFPLETTEYRVFLEDGRGCKDTLTTVVRVTEGVALLDSQYIEPCDTLPRMRVIGDLAPAANAVWQLNGEALAVVNNTFDFVPDSAGQYTFIATTQNNGCIFSDTLTVGIEYNPIGLGFQAAVVGGAEPLCQGDTVALSATEGFIYQWFPSEGLSANNTASVLAFPQTTTTYKVIISNGKENCQVEREATIEVFPEIVFDITYDFQYECGAYPRLVINNQSTGASEYRWDWEGNTFSTELAPLPYLPNRAGEQTLVVEGNNLKCRSTESFQIDIPEIVIPPNVITPNDDGKNDTFQLTGAQGWLLQLYDRWGRLVYESKDYQNDWAGEGNSGETFYYVLVAPDGTVCKGWVQLLGE